MRRAIFSSVIILYAAALLSCVNNGRASLWFLARIATAPNVDSESRTLEAVIIAGAIALEHRQQTGIWPDSINAIIGRAQIENPAPWIVDELKVLSCSPINKHQLAIWQGPQKTQLAIIDDDDIIEIPWRSPLLNSKTTKPVIGPQPTISPEARLVGIALEDFITQLLKQR